MGINLQKRLNKLAINGGPKLRTKLFPSQAYTGKEERKAVNNFMKGTPILSAHRGSWSSNFWGGKNIQKLEGEIADKFFTGEDLHVLAVNSCTSALQIACGALELTSKDEVIVTPWSMSCSATAPMVWGAKPIFADIEYDNFCLSADDIEIKITKHTKAIIVVDLFGQPYDVERINAIAKKHNLKVIEDAAQAIGSTYNGKYAGTLGDIGCFSFTQGKHLTAGEGGAIVTKDYDLYMKCAMLRNHQEAVAHGMDDFWLHRLGEKFLQLPGSNLRMTEIQAIIVSEQLKKLDSFIEYRRNNVKYLQEGLSKLDGIDIVSVRENCTHSWYVLPFYFDESVVGVSRNKFIDAVKAELTCEETRIDRGIPIGNGYINPLYNFPIFKLNKKYKGVYCRNAEKLHDSDLFITLYHGLQLSRRDVEDIIAAFYKVYNNIDELKEV